MPYPWPGCLYLPLSYLLNYRRSLDFAPSPLLNGDTGIRLSSSIPRSLFYSFRFKRCPLDKKTLSSAGLQSSLTDLDLDFETGMGMIHLRGLSWIPQKALALRSIFLNP